MNNITNQYIVQQAKFLFGEVKGIYAERIHEDTEEILYEIAVQAQSSVSERKGVEATVGEKLVFMAITLFPGASVNNSYSDRTRCKKSF